MYKAIVVSKFKEDVSWLSRLTPDWARFIYSKDPAENSPSFMRLPNTGRESHTYLTFIIDNYDQLPELCVFTQGNPLEHAPDFLKDLGSLSLPCPYHPLSPDEVLFDHLGMPHLAASPLALDGSSFSDFFEKVMGSKPPVLIYCRMNGLFAVDRNTLHSRSPEFYKHCLTLLSGASEEEFQRRIGLNVIEGHFFERLWQFIFSNYPDDNWIGSVVHGMPAERLRIVAPLLEKWPGEVKRVGVVKASAVLLAANEILQQSLGR